MTDTDRRRRPRRALPGFRAWQDRHPALWSSRHVVLNLFGLVATVLGVGLLLRLLADRLLPPPRPRGADPGPPGLAAPPRPVALPAARTRAGGRPATRRRPPGRSAVAQDRRRPARRRRGVGARGPQAHPRS